ncbi:MAG: DUF3320 domain-containing protein [Acidimicrobiales bacterium]
MCDVVEKARMTVGTPGSHASGVVADHLDRWAADLVDLSRRNKLLYFSHTRSSSLEFKQPAVEVEEGLTGRSRGWRFFLPPEPPSPRTGAAPVHRPGRDELVVAFDDRTGVQIERSLKLLSKTARQEFLDTGLWVLFLGLGHLNWIDVDDKPARSPLLLVPVELEMESGRWRLTKTDEAEAYLNPALKIKLERDFGLMLPDLDEAGDATVNEVLALVRREVAASGWTVGDSAVLRTFTFHKMAIYQDLKENAELIGAHPLVRLLAEGPTSAMAQDLDFAPLGEEELDERHPPEELAAVLDADVTQRQCLLAAREGRSFVMDGPPGTGKSQTIANFLAQLMADGKTVLFVSEKAAALDVVRNRLAAAHLDPFVLELHSHNASRKAVATALGKALEEQLSATSTFDPGRRARLTSERQMLTNYAVAVNEVRQPLQRSIHDVAGRISQLRNLPDVPISRVAAEDLSPVGFATLRDAAERLGRAWGPIARREDFLWRDLRDPAGGMSRQAELRRRVNSCSAALDTLRAELDNLAQELVIARCSSSSQVSSYLAVLELIERRPQIGQDWLTAPDLAPFVAPLRNLTQNIVDHQRTVELLETKAPGWRDVHPLIADAMDGAEAAVQQADSMLGPLDQWHASALDDLAQQLDEAGQWVAQLQGASSILAEAFGVAGVEVSAESTLRLVELASLAGSPTPPEPWWLNPTARPALDEARQVLRELLERYRARSVSMQTTFSPAVLDLDLRALKARFDTVHRGPGKLKAEYRHDKKSLAGVSVTGKVTSDMLDRLAEAIEWQDERQRITQAERVHGPQVGARYYPSRDAADFATLERALSLADKALELAAGLVDSPALARQLAVGSDPDPRFPAAVAAARAAATALATGRLSSTLGAHAAVVFRRPLSEVASWCGSLATTAHHVAQVVRVLDTAAAKPLLIADARQIAHARRELDRLDPLVREDLAHLQPILGPLAVDPHPDLLRSAAAWVAEMRECLRGAVPPRTAAAILGASLDAAALRGAKAMFDKAVAALMGEFDPAYAATLAADMETFEGGVELLAALSSTVNDIEEWHSYAQARSWLCESGWEPVVSTLEHSRAAATDIADTIERAALTRWLDDTMSVDSRLQPTRSTDRDALVADFQALDRELIADAASKVINACAQLRPRSLAGGAGVIRQQAQLKVRHKPVRRLLSEAGEAAQRLMPCFMMSPLSVSQFLPPSLRFDVVIFDEASQVREADAICAIYRGNQLIVAGDPKQLPPTDFFARTVGEDDWEAEGEELLDFESVLDRCRAQGLPTLPLSWHYRSRHENLIAFSNHSFYEGRLHTFPGAIHTAPDLGVELFKVNGHYRRGTSRDNPIEAAEVVDRVLFHRRNHPGLSIGVVALSSAQQICIETEIERRSEREPELRELEDADRLSGFFVKNLENVQGDERDIIILSVGYGPDEHGKLTMNFGPMNRQGGERRLNVAVTRARHRLEVVSSVVAGQITSETPSLRHLARYLDFAERGPAALALDVTGSSLGPDSPFEEDVGAAIRRLGLEAVPQVGVAGYRIDIGIKHPTLPGSFVLGVECDGYTYHSSKVARDRDRLRQEVLEGLGWHIHRIWSTAWLSDRERELQRIRDAVKAALSTAPSRRGQPEAEERRPPVMVVTERNDFDARPEWAEFFVPPTVRTTPPALDFVDPAARGVVRAMLVEVVREFGPLHHSAVLDAVRSAWNIKRAGSRIQAAFDAAAQQAVSRQEVETDGQFFRVPGSQTAVRIPNEEHSVRAVGHVPPEELRLALLYKLHDAGGAIPEELRMEWARLFGWRRVGADIDAAFERHVHDLINGGQVLRDGRGQLRLR